MRRTALFYQAYLDLSNAALFTALNRDTQEIYAELVPFDAGLAQRMSDRAVTVVLDLTNQPRWHDLAPGVRAELRPLATALMVATRSDPGVEAVPVDASDEERAVAFAKALARLAVLSWEGIGDADGNEIDPGPDAVDALLDIWPIFETFQLTYVSKGLLLEQEKNVSAPLPIGHSAGASATAKPARKPAKTVRRG